MIWERVKLGDVTDSCLGKMLDKRKNKGTYKPYLANVNVRWGAFDLDNLQEMKFEDDEDERYGIKYGDLIICEGGEPGRCAIWKEQLPNMKIQKALHRLRVNEEMDYRYVYYWFLLAGKQGALKQYYTGATIMHMPGQKLKEVVIDKPPLDVQRKIGDYLEAFDDLIENNQKQIKLLEEAAQRLYKEWFVDLRFPGYEDVDVVDGVPEGWSKGKAENFFNITIGKTPPRAEKQWFVKNNIGVPWVSISDMGNAGVYVFETSEDLTQEAVKKYNMKVVPSGTIFVSFKLTVGRVSIATKNMCTNEAIAHFYIDDDSKQAYTYCYLNNFEYDTLGNTSSISKAINSKIIKAMPFVMPDEVTILAFDRLVAPILKTIKNKLEVCIKLKEARDRLLPKLMSGEIKV